MHRALDLGPRFEYFDRTFISSLFAFPGPVFSVELTRPNHPRNHAVIASHHHQRDAALCNDPRPTSLSADQRSEQSVKSRSATRVLRFCIYALQERSERLRSFLAGDRVSHTRRM